MTLQTDLEQAVARAKSDSDKLKAIVNGPASGATSTVDVDSGSVKTVARALAEVGDTSAQASKDLGNVDDADLVARLRAAGESHGFKVNPAVPEDMTVTVGEGNVPRLALPPLTVAEQGLGPFAAPAAEPRHDIVHVDRLSGTVAVAAGTEAASPTDPAIPPGNQPIARVRLLPAMSVIAAGDIDDLRDGLIGLGSAAVRDAGTGPGELVQLDGAGKLPAVDGAALDGVLTQGLREYMVMASAVQPAVDQGCGLVESLALGAGKPDLVFRTFDASVAESGVLLLPLPKSWDGGGIAFQVVWTHAVTATDFGVVWSMDAAAIGDDEPGNIALGSASDTADTGGTADDIYVSDWSGPVAIAGTPADGDLVCLRLTRNVAHLADTLAVDARLIALRLRLNLVQGNDA